MKKLTVAAAQAVSTRGEVQQNVEHHVRLATLAAGAGACLTVFPELSLTGYAPDLAAELAFSEADSRLAPLQQCAAATGSTIVAGAPVRLGTRLCIGAFIIPPDQTLQLYTKLHPTQDERRVFAPGDRDPTIDVLGELGAAAICADTTHPSHAARAARRGADHYLAGVFFAPETIQAHRKRLAGYASEHAMVVAMANAGAATAQFDSGGNTSIWCPRVSCIVHIDGLGPGVALATRSHQGWLGDVLLL